MAASVFDSPLMAGLFPAGTVQRLFSDSAAIRAMLLVEGKLAEVQGRLGVIPELSATAIARAAMEVQVDPANLADATGRNGVCVPALVAAFRDEMQAPEHAQFIHWGATSQDIIDTGLMLRLRQSLALIERDLRAALTALADLADTHAALPMLARTYGQPATPTSFGAVVAGWGTPLVTLIEDLEALRRTCLLVSLSGAAGTSAALGSHAADIRAGLADALGLGDPGRTWHTDRTPVLRIADWLVRLCLALGKMGEDLSGLAAGSVQEVQSGTGGASSTMPQKRNPVAAATLIALARHATGLSGILHSAAIHRDQRDGGAWFSEWMCLPQIVLGAAASAHIATGLAPTITPAPDAMAAALAADHGLIHAEALTFALTAQMPRPQAQETVKTLCAETRASGTALRDLAARDWPLPDIAALFDPARQMGLAPDDARRFAATVRALPGPV